MTITLEFTDQELRALQAVLDLACKAGGMQIAPTCVVLANKLQQASATQNPQSNGHAELAGEGAATPPNPRRPRTHAG